MTRVLVALLLVAIGRPAAAAESWRTALVVANNAGNGARPPLRYAEDDAVKVSRVLIELGGFRAEDVRLLAGRSLADTRAALAEVKQKIAAAHARGQRVVMLFYFSGHSDGQGLEIGGDNWPFSEVRAALAGVGAEIRLAIVDSCRSGALLAKKGGTPGPAFDITFSDDLATAGEAVLTSSAADEMALESREIRGSFFSHHLVSGLRGAADSSGDGRVTLNEAYWYAFEHTLLATSGTLNGPQHPAYDYSITGQGDLVLTEVMARGSHLILPTGFDRILIADGERRHVLAELTNDSAHRIALPPGPYIVEARRQGHAFEAPVTLALGQSTTLGAQDLADAGASLAVAKGDDGPSIAAQATVGAMHGAAAALSWIPGVRLGARLGASRGWLLEGELGRGETSTFQETTVRGSAGAFVAARRGPWRGELAWRIVAGPIQQVLDQGGSHATWAFGTGPQLGGSVLVSRWLAVVAMLGADALSLRRDDARTVVLWPTAFAGVDLDF